ncbi:MAG: LptF/LptG family permease [Phycisphaerales bacterium]
MPRILFRHILADLLRIKVLTASVLVAVIAFGAAIRPIMQNLLGAEDLLQYVALASVPMLQFALPFAGAFAGTIVYARLASDNEVLAMSAAGLSYRRILMPAVGLGCILLVAMALLVDSAVPRFWTSMQRLITRDVTRLFVSAIERGEALVIDRTQLYADDYAVIEHPGGATDGSGGPATRLALAGVAAIEIGPDGRPTTEFTAELATVDVYRENDSAYLKLLFKNATAFSGEEGALVYVPQAEPEAIDLGKGIRLKPKDLDLRGLVGVWRDIESYHGVAEPRARAIAALGAVDFWSCIAQRLAADGSVRLVDRDGRRAIEIRNARIAGERLLPREGAALELVELERGSVGRRASVSEAILRADARAEPRADPQGGGPLPELELLASADHVVDARGSTSGRWPARIAGLAPSQCTVRARAGAAVADISAEARALGAERLDRATTDPVARATIAAADAARAMDESVRLVRADIVARVVQRINQSFAAPLMLLLGAVLAIRLRGANPLQIYLLAFIPSIIDILLISGGEQMLKEATSAAGVFVCSSGNLGIAAMIAIAYRQVARN